jgi:hypothetical protein
MPNISGTHLCIYVSGLVLVLLLLGLFGSKYLTFDINDNPYSPTIENLNVPSVSSSGDVSSGASELYGWGYTPIIKKHKSSVKPRKCPSCENIYSDEPDMCILCQGNDKDCRFADITQNVNIDKYVLKSSIPPCPDLSEYAKKNMIPAYPFNKNEWILKSEIPPCPQIPNLNDYVRKSEIPACMENSGNNCPECPVAPICPVAPPCAGEKIKVVEKIIYKDRPFSQEELNYKNNYGYLPNNINYYPQNGGTWTPKLSELNEGFINEPLVPSINISRGMEVFRSRKNKK